MEPPFVLRLDALTCATSEALAPLTLTLAQGELLVIGNLPEPASTCLARTLLGLAPVLAGSACLFGQDIARLSRLQWLELHRKTALLRLTDGFFPAWSAIDNLMLPAIQAGRGSRQERRLLEDSLTAEARRYGIDARWLEEPVVNRSAPQRAALSLWRALRSRPVFILIDEHLPEPDPGDERVDLEQMWRDALVAKPALLLLTSSQPERLPQAFQGLQYRHARIRNARLEWTSPASPWSQDHAIAARS